MLNRNRRQFVAWIAALALLSHALLVPIARAMAAGHVSAPHWTAICTSTGVQRVALQDPGQPAGEQHRADKDHCPFCRLPSPDALATGPVNRLVLLTGLRHATPVASKNEPPHNDRWRPAAARAPPRFS